METQLPNKAIIELFQNRQLHQGKMLMYCYSCGKEIPENSKFCPECGTSTALFAEEVPIVAEAKEDARTFVQTPVEPTAAEKSQRNSLLLISAVLGTIAIAAILGFLFLVTAAAIGSSTPSTTSTLDEVAVLYPELTLFILLLPVIITIIAVVCNWIAWATSKPGWAMASGIIYVIAMIISLSVLIVAVVAEAVLCFVAFAKLRKEQAQS